MAESLLGGLLGDDEEKAEVEAPAALAGAEAFASAVAAKLAGHDPEVARDTSAFLKEQTQLLKIQTEHLKDEHAARLHYLRGQAREVDIRRFGLHLRIGFQLFLVLAATAAAARGLTGAWTSNIRLEVPETGISLAEISRLMRERFGHDVHIDGDLTESATGDLALTVRGNGVLPKTFSGSATELKKLTVDAAEYVYSKSQPARYASYLASAERYPEAIAFCQTSIASVDPTERPGLFNAWGIAIQSSGGSIREALALYRAAVRIQPDFWVAHVNIENALMLLGDEEGAWRDGEDMRTTAGGRPGRAPENNYVNWDALTWNLGPWLAATLQDAQANGGAGTEVSSDGTAIADIQARLHDPDAAELALKTTRQDPHDPTLAAMTHFVRGRLAAQAGDAAAAVAEMEAFGTASADPAVYDNTPGYNCWIAPAEEAAGHPDKADALLKTAGTFVDCHRFRADILDGRGDWAGAQKAYADAVARARHGDFAGAESKLKDARGAIAKQTRA